MLIFGAVIFLNVDVDMPRTAVPLMCSESFLMNFISLLYFCFSNNHLPFCEDIS